MPLAPGTRLGPYEVTAQIGVGGMGEVYRGRDATLNRDVAIKALPAALASDTERLARFKREAQVLASLNHPNIAHVYGFDSISAWPRLSGFDRLSHREQGTLSSSKRPQPCPATRPKPGSALRARSLAERS